MLLDFLPSEYFTPDKAVEVARMLRYAKVPIRTKKLAWIQYMRWLGYRYFEAQFLYIFGILAIWPGLFEEEE